MSQARMKVAGSSSRLFSAGLQGVSVGEDPVTVPYVP